MSYLLKHVSGHVLTPQMAQVYTVFTSWMGTLHLQGRSQGGPGVPVTPPCASLFNQTTYNRWRKCHDDTSAIVTIWWVPSLWHSVTRPLWKILATPLHLALVSWDMRWWKWSLGPDTILCWRCVHLINTTTLPCRRTPCNTMQTFPLMIRAYETALWSDKSEKPFWEVLSGACSSFSVWPCSSFSAGPVRRLV